MLQRWLWTAKRRHGLPLVESFPNSTCLRQIQSGLFAVGECICQTDACKFVHTHSQQRRQQCERLLI